MSERVDRYPIEGTPRIQVRIGSGGIRIVEGGTEGEVVVRLKGSSSTIDRYRVEQSGDLIEIGPAPDKRRGMGSMQVVVETPVAPEISARLASCDFGTVVPVAELQVDTASGDVQADQVHGDVAIRSASGDVRVGSVDGYFKATLASGDVRIGVVKAGADVKTASGDVSIKIAEGGIKAKSASGDVSVANLRDGDIDIKSLSGDAIVGVPKGRTLEVSLDTVSGKVKTEFPVVPGGSDPDDDATRGVSVIGLKTVSGDIIIRPAG